MSDTTLATAAMWVRRIDDPQFSERDLAAFEHWIGLDVQNRDAFEQAQAVWVETQLPDSSIDQILALAPTGKPRSWFLPKGRWLVSGLAGGMASLALAYLFMQTTLPAPQPGPDTGSFQTVGTETGMTRTLRLADGSELQLNTQTELSYDMEGDTRRIRLVQGEVFFQVAKDPQHPFEIRTRDHLIRVLGTAFNVRNYDGDYELYVTEGTVRLSGRGLSGPIDLTRGRSAMIDKAGHVSIDRLDENRSLAWRSGMIVFEDETLSRILHEIDRYFPEDLSPLAAGADDSQRYSAVLHIDDLNQVLEQLSAISSQELDPPEAPSPQ